MRLRFAVGCVLLGIVLAGGYGCMDWAADVDRTAVRPRGLVIYEILIKLVIACLCAHLFQSH